MAVLTLAVGRRPGRSRRLSPRSGGVEITGRTERTGALSKEERNSRSLDFVCADRPEMPNKWTGTQDEAQKNWHVQPVAATHQQVMPANNTHAGFRLRRACSDSLFLELRGMWHQYSPR